jgi:hypothetical protein
VIQRLKQFVASVYSWKLNLILERIYVMSLNLEALNAAIDSIIAKDGAAVQAVATAQADRDKALSALADAEAKAATDNAGAQAQIDALTAKLGG